MSARNEDLLFMADLQSAAKRGPQLIASLLLLSIFTFVVVFIVWASQAYLDQVTKGQGKVVPSSQIKVVQNLEGGIIRSISVREGQVVTEGEVLMQIDDTSLSAQFRETETEREALTARITRLQAETEGKEPVFDAAFSEKRKDLVSDEVNLFQARQQELSSSAQILEGQANQRRQELKELEGRIAALTKQINFAQKEYDILAPNVEKGAVSRLELLQIERELEDLKGKRQAARLAVPRIKSAITEASDKVKVSRETFRLEALQELRDTRTRLDALREVQTAQRDRVERTEVRSPVGGVVKTVHVTTLGGVVQPGSDLVEIVPQDDSLLVEAMIKPSDIAFLSPGQNAEVKITAYDFGLYGALEGVLENISADTVLNPDGESMYEIRVRTDRNWLGEETDPLPIIPGMVAEVDILTGKKTVLDYIMNPFLKARSSALRE